MTRPTVVRILKARQRRQAKAWAARAEVLRRQLAAMRGTYPS